MNRPAWIDGLFGSLIKKVLLIVVVIATPVFAIWVAFADLSIPTIPTWLGLLGAVGLGGLFAWLFQACATRLTKKGD